MILPVIHMNGTSAESLTEDLCNAYLALGEAYDKLKQCAPNGRDYYPVPGLLDKATAEHRRRLQAIDDLRSELEALCTGIQDGGHKS